MRVWLEVRLSAGQVLGLNLAQFPALILAIKEEAMSRPTLARQLAEKKRREELEKLSGEELLKLLFPHTFWQHVSFWFFLHLPLLHNWFWGIVCWFYPWSMETKTRYWRWENPPE